VRVRARTAGQALHFHYYVLPSYNPATTPLSNGNFKILYFQMIQVRLVLAE